MKSLYHFLGSIRFTIVLIATVTLAVIAATIAEAYTESHLYAEMIAYKSPYFLVLITGFFANILLSTLRRMPFRRRHIPFLLTHLGLLMLLTGVFVKNIYGVQGTLLLSEGAASDALLVSGSEALLVEAKEGGSYFYEISAAEKKQGPLTVKTISRAPHCKERLTSWMKGDYATIRGLPPLPVRQWKRGAIAPSGQAPIRDGDEMWDLYALRAEEPAAAAEDVYLSGIEIQCPGARIRMEGLEAAVVTLENGEEVSLRLSGPGALYNEQGVTISRRPAVAFIEGPEKEILLFAIDPHGRCWHERFSSERPPRLYVYDKGYGGYATTASLPFPRVLGSLDQMVGARSRQLKRALEEALEDKGSNLAPPLALLREGCTRCGVLFPDTFVSFIDEWRLKGDWLFFDKAPPAVEAIDWSSLPSELVNSCGWLSWIVKEASSCKSVGDFLAKSKWPFLSNFEVLSESDLLSALASQMVQVGPLLPPPPAEPSPSELLSAYMRLYGIGYETIMPPPPKNKGEELALFEGAKPSFFEEPRIECRVTPGFDEAEPSLKLEDNIPLLSLLIAKAGRSKEFVKLAFDRTAAGLRWPLFNGDYLVRYQPMVLRLPYRLRLREARRIDYAHSQQPCSYECSLYVAGGHSGTVEEVEMSMNNVFETWEGYRFYLGSISGGEGQLKRVQLIVNYDPAKYLLTYPGGLFIALGSFLLFWRKSWFVD